MKKYPTLVKKMATVLIVFLITHTAKAQMDISYFSTAIKYKQELKLTGEQLDSLSNKNIEFETIKKLAQRDGIKSKFNELDVKKYEAGNIMAILHPSQLKDMLFLKNSAKAAAITADNWVKIKRYGLSSSSDSVFINKFNLNYQLYLLVAAEQLNFDPRPETEGYRRLLENNKPYILAKLDEIEGRKITEFDIRRSFTW